MSIGAWQLMTRAQGRGQMCHVHTGLLRPRPLESLPRSGTVGGEICCLLCLPRASLPRQWAMCGQTSVQHHTHTHLSSLTRNGQRAQPSVGRHGACKRPPYESHVEQEVFHDMTASAANLGRGVRAARVVISVRLNRTSIHRAIVGVVT